MVRSSPATSGGAVLPNDPMFIHDPVAYSEYLLHALSLHVDRVSR